MSAYAIQNATLGLALLAAPLAGQGKQVGGLHQHLSQAAILTSQGRYAEARRLGEFVVERVPESAAAWFQLGLAQQLLEDASAARTSARKVVEIDPKHARAHLMLAETATDADEATTEANLAVELDPAAASIATRAVETLVRHRRLDAARALMKSVREHHADNVAVLELEAKVAFDAGAPALAVDALRELTRLQPRHPHHLENLAGALAVIGKKRDAVVAFRAALEVHPSNTRARQRLIGLLRDLNVDRKQIETQERYVEYYENLREQAGKRVTPPQSRVVRHRPQSGRPLRVAR